jgi:hypothetical protein
MSHEKFNRPAKIFGLATFRAEPTTPVTTVEKNCAKYWYSLVNDLYSDEVAHTARCGINPMSFLQKEEISENPKKVISAGVSGLSQRILLQRSAN